VHQPCSRVSKTQLVWGSTRTTCHFIRGCGREVMHLPCKQAKAGALPAASTNFRHAKMPRRSSNERRRAFILRGTRLKHREKPHKLLQVGVIPTPATISVTSFELRVQSYTVFGLLRAVLIDDIAIAASSPASRNKAPATSLEDFPASTRSSIQNPDSSASSSTV
jgi:hypothetical protein